MIDPEALQQARDRALAALNEAQRRLNIYTVTWVDAAGELHGHAEADMSQHHWRATLRHLGFLNGALEGAKVIHMEMLEGSTT